MSAKPSQRVSALTHQAKIFLNGGAGIKPIVPIDPIALEEKAQKHMTSQSAAYILGGAGKEETIRANRHGFERWQIVPRMLRNVETRDTAIHFLGSKIHFPLFLAPIGVLEMVHRKADLAVAAAAAETGTPMIISNQASFSMETIAKVLGDSPKLFQLYWSKSNELVESLVRRVEDIDAQAIVLTLDTTMLGWRNRDLTEAYLPFLRGEGIAQYTSDPVFQKLAAHFQPAASAPKPPVTLATLGMLLRQAHNVPGSFLRNLTSGYALRSVRAFIHYFVRPSLNWENLAFLQDLTSLPIILKGKAQ
ncbi:MAG: alpha-hydroxy-acid oxidizing protein [Bacteroidota bacterium]